jgi:hypothetical protein
MRRRKWACSAVMLFGVLLAADCAPSWGQTYVVVPQGRVRASRMARRGYAVVAPRGVLPAFGGRGGIGTTPYLGNTRGLGAYSTNYGFARQAGPRWVWRGRWR